MDQIEADLVLLSTEAVHSKAVDANLLAEFVDCPGVHPRHLLSNGVVLAPSS